MKGDILQEKCGKQPSISNVKRETCSVDLWNNVGGRFKDTNDRFWTSVLEMVDFFQ